MEREEKLKSTLKPEEKPSEEEVFYLNIQGEKVEGQRKEEEGGDNLERSRRRLRIAEI